MSDTGVKPGTTLVNYLTNLLKILFASVPLMLLTVVIGIIVRLHIESFMVGYRMVEVYIIN